MSQNIFLHIQDLTKSYAGQTVVDGLSLQIRHGEMVSLLGPSGCGKTTTLRMIGGFLDPDAGDILLENTSLLHVPAEQRPVCTVFQSYALFPHMTVVENVAYGLRCHDFDRKTARNRAMAMLDTVDLAGLGGQNVSRLSGGQQQRVALARALVLNPRVLLLDEPFSNLDANLRLQMREEVRRLQHRFNLTTLFVTHDRDEAMALSDRIAVMQHGRIAQIGTPKEIYLSPVNRFVAQSVGMVNCVFLEGREVLVRPEHVIIVDCPGDVIGKVRSLSFLGHLTRCHIDCGSNTIIADATSDSAATLSPGQQVGLRFTRLLTAG